LPDLSGRTITLTQYRGKPLLLQFWTSASSDCLKDLETFRRQRASWGRLGLQLLSLNTDDAFSEPALRRFTKNDSLPFPLLHATDDVAGIYNLLYRYVFDRHRDLPLPASFLINDHGYIVKIYQGPVNADHIAQDFVHIPQSPQERLAKALPFPGVTDATEFQRNYLALGSVFFQREYFDQAKAFFELAQHDDPSSAEARYGLGSVYLKQSKTTEARDCFERATKLLASFPETLPNAWNNLGLLATQEGRTDAAIPFFQQALKLSPNHLIALDNLASAYRQQKRWPEARQVLEHALAVSPQNPEANYSLGMVYAQTNDEQRASDYLQRALQARPDYPEALNNIGVLKLRTGHRDDAVKTFEECMRVAPDFDQAYLNLARVYALEGDREKARAVLDSLLRRHPEHAAAKGMLADLSR
jgi:tetratricopeptide (TPR) repeat protein